MAGHGNDEYRDLMTREKTVTLGDERDRIDAELDELVDQLADADAETQGAQRLISEARDLDQSGAAVAALADEYGDEATVTVRELDGEAWARMEDRVDTMRNAKAGPGGVPGSSRNVYAAAGLVDAPFLNGVGSDALGDKTGAVAELTPAPGAQKWLESLVDDVGSVDEGNWRPLVARLQGTLDS